MPRLLNLSQKVKEKLAHWFSRELEDHLAERPEWINRIERWRTDYNAYPSTEESSFPFKGASSIIIPLTAIAAEATIARAMQTLYPLDQKIAVNIHDPANTHLELELERYLTKDFFDMQCFRENTESSVLEIVKYGTGAAETGYEKITRKGVRGEKEEEFEFVVSEGAYVRAVPVTDVVKPMSDIDLQTSRWSGRIVRLNPYEIRQREDSGHFDEGTYEKLARFFDKEYYSTDNSYRNEVNRQLKQEPTLPQEITFYFIHTAWDVDEADYDKEICFYYNDDLKEIVGAYYNLFSDLRRPIRTGVYFPEEFRWTGIGICQQNEQFQMEVTTQHRQRLDNATIANLQMFVIKRDAVTIEPDEQLFPGKLWFVDDPSDIQALSLGDVKVSSYNNENQAVIYSQQRTGVNELTLGMPQTGTPGTATDAAARVQESARKADYVLNNIRNFQNTLLTDAFCNVVQFGPRIDLLKYSPQAAELELFLKNPYDLFRKKIIATIQLVGQNQNRFMDRQNVTQFSGVVQQYYKSLLELAMQTQNQQLVQVISEKALEGANEAMKFILSNFEIREPEKFLIQLPTSNVAPTGQTPAAPTPGMVEQGGVQAPIVPPQLEERFADPSAYQL